MSDDTSTDDPTLDASEQRRAVRDRYGQVASEEGCSGDGSDSETDSPDEAATETPCCSGSSSVSSCCGESTTTAERARETGYSEADLEAAPAAANMGLSCGNPTAIANLTTGETVLDLGSGGGFDCFLAADAVGPTGRVIGVDMTPEMVERARENAEEYDGGGVEFRLGEIEHLPVADRVVDVVISNCVLNLSPDKSQVFREVYRVLHPGGRIAISDVVRTADLPPAFRLDPDAVSACIGGAASPAELEAMLEDAGFVDVTIEPKDDDEFITEWHPDRDPREYVTAARIQASKPSSGAVSES